MAAVGTNTKTKADIKACSIELLTTAPTSNSNGSGTSFTAYDTLVENADYKLTQRNQNFEPAGGGCDVAVPTGKGWDLTLKVKQGADTPALIAAINTQLASGFVWLRITVTVGSATGIKYTGLLDTADNSMGDWLTEGFTIKSIGFMPG